jgi:UDP-N-acetylmuramoylalanine--D-glutamate ligase
MVRLDSLSIAPVTSDSKTSIQCTKLSGKHALILGLAREGESLARYLVRQGAVVTVTDVLPEDQLQPRLQRLEPCGVHFVLGKTDPHLVNSTDVLFVSPGVPTDNPIVMAAREAGIPITNATQLFLEHCPATVVGITGSSGKTTTTSLIAAILHAGNRRVLVGGNIGNPMLDLLDDADSQTLVVVELSSFQLELVQVSPHIAVVTNITPNHLDRHGTMARYIAAKQHIVAYQTPNDVAVLNQDDRTVKTFASTTPAHSIGFSRCGRLEKGAFLYNDALVVRTADAEFVVMPRDEIPIPGNHNVENVLAALAATSTLDVDASAMREGVRTFAGVPHRLEHVTELDGVTYIDDSIATSPQRVAVALQAVDRNVVLIAGGRSKQLPWHDMLQAMDSHVRALVLIGEAAQEIAQAVEAHFGREAPPIHYADTMDDAVQRAARLALPGDVVLLSPACASYDMFTDYEERGLAFRHAVEELGGHRS